MLFSSLSFYAVENIDPKIIHLLNVNGASQFGYLGELVDVVICDNTHCVEYNEARDLFDLPVVRSAWVSLSLHCGELLTFKALSLDPKNVFHGVSAALKVGEDLNALWGMLTFHGADVTAEITRTTTHVVTTDRTQRGIHVVTPDWVVDSLRGRVSESGYHPMQYEGGILAGLVFQIDPSVGEDMTSLISMHGGTISETYSHYVTLFQDTVACGKAILHRKHVVSPFWLGDVLALSPPAIPSPWKAIHLPRLCADYLPCRGLEVTTSGFSKEERGTVIRMLRLLGGMYSAVLRGTTAVVIANIVQSPKVDKATSLDLPVVNLQWLSDLFLGHLSALKLPVPPQYKKAMTNVFEWTKGLSCTPADKVDKVVITFTGIEEAKVGRLKNMALSLGGVVPAQPGNCTHIVADRFCRSLKFLCAINHCLYVLTSRWIDDSVAAGLFMPEANYALKDVQTEQEVGFTLREVMTRARRGKVFAGLEFHVTANVVPDVQALRPIIENCGGVYLTDMPLQGSEGTIIITCERDLLISPHFSERVYAPELVISSAFSQLLLLDRFILR